MPRGDVVATHNSRKKECRPDFTTSRLRPFISMVTTRELVKSGRWNEKQEAVLRFLNTTTPFLINSSRLREFLTLYAEHRLLLFISISYVHEFIVVHATRDLRVLYKCHTSCVLQHCLIFSTQCPDFTSSRVVTIQLYTTQLSFFVCCVSAMGQCCTINSKAMGTCSLHFIFVCRPSATRVVCCNTASGFSSRLPDFTSSRVVPIQLYARSRELTKSGRHS